MEALLIIDMLNDFIAEKGTLQCGDAGRAIVPFVRNKISEFRGNVSRIFFICDNHEEDDAEFAHFPRHCVRDSWGARIVSQLSPAENDTVIFKKRYSAFFDTNIESLLEGCERVHFVGVCTNICILFSVEEAYNRGFKTVVYKDGVASFDESAHRHSLEQMKSLFGADIR